MLELARSPQAGDRDRLLLALADLCERDGGGSEQARTLLGEVLMGLIGRVERDIRIRLAGKLAGASWAPHALVVFLAHDEIEVARPLLHRSPMLDEQDLVRLLAEAALDHRVQVARRPGLGSAVSTAILDQGTPEVVYALAANASAQLTPLALERLVLMSQTMAELRAPLARHPSLTAELGAILYVWVGEALRRSLCERFAVDGPAFEQAVEAAVSEARGAPGDGTSLELDERAAMERRVVGKLKAGGQLRPGLLLRSLRDGKLTLFTIALAELGDFTTDEVRRAMDAASPELLALAFAAVGVDRGAVPSLLAALRTLNAGLPGTEGEAAEVQGCLTLLDATRRRAPSASASTPFDKASRARLEGAGRAGSRRLAAL